VTTKIAVRRGLADGWRPFASIASRTPRVIILIYHAVTNGEASDAAQLTVSRQGFADQMRWLRELGYPVVTLGSAVRDLRAGALRSPVVVLTFDDGYRSFYDQALPVLTEYGYPASLYVVPSAIDGTCPPGALPEHLGPFLSWGEARECARHGVTVGAHSMTHRKLAQLPADEARREAVDSKRAIEDRLGVAVDEFCYPFGSFDSFSDDTERMLMEVGFVAVCASVAGHNTVPRDVSRLKRLRVSWIDDSKTEIAKQCAGAYNWYALVQRAQAWRRRP
jgi:peptidoglycan/xylan/chitin deacetylase (PgdA/CDA1 family)